MNNKIKKALPSLCLLGVPLGRIINRILTHYYGRNTTAKIETVYIVSLICATLIFAVILSAFMKQHATAVGLFIMTIPFIVMWAGMYQDKIELTGLGIALIFIIYPIMIFIMKRIRKN